MAKGKHFSYVRFSTPDQKMGDSERRQLEYARAWAKRKDVELDESITPDRGRSGFHGTHRTKGHLGRFLALVEAGDIPEGSTLVVENMDRLGREGPMKMIREIIGKLWDHGVTIQTVAPEETYEPGCDGHPKFLALMIYVQLAYEESRKKAQRHKDLWTAFRRDLAEGKKPAPKGDTPAWLRYDWQAREFEVIPEAAEAVRLIFKMATDGLGLNRIVRRLNGEGGPRVPGIGRSGVWHEGYVGQLLSLRDVLGEFTTKDGRVHQGYYPAIVTPDEWHAARAAMSARKIGTKGVGRQGKNVANLFSGLLRDARDGEVLHIYTHAAKKGRRRQSLISAGVKRGEAASDGGMIPYALLERAFLRFVRELKPADLTGDGRGEEEKHLKVLAGRAATLVANIEKAKARARKGGDLDAIFDLLAGWEAELKEVRAEQEKAKVALTTDRGASLGDAQEVIDALSRAEGDERAELRRRLKQRIRELVSEMWLISWAVTPRIRAAEVQITFTAGHVRSICYAWVMGGRYIGCSVNFGGLIGIPSDDAHLADKRLANYRTDVDTRAWNLVHRELLNPTLAQAVEEEIERRYAKRDADKKDGTDTLGAYLAGTLDGTRPPVFTGRPPRKVVTA